MSKSTHVRVTRAELLAATPEEIIAKGMIRDRPRMSCIKWLYERGMLEWRGAQWQDTPEMRRIAAKWSGRMRW